MDELKKQGVDCIKAILEAGGGGRIFNRLDTALFDAVAQEAHADSLPLVVHTGDARDVADAVQAKADCIEHGSFRDKIPDALFEQMAKQGAFTIPRSAWARRSKTSLQEMLSCSSALWCSKWVRLTCFAEPKTP